MKFFKKYKFCRSIGMSIMKSIKASLDNGFIQIG